MVNHLISELSTAREPLCTGFFSTLLGHISPVVISPVMATVPSRQAADVTGRSVGYRSIGGER